jgi:hypothetical protein
MNINDLIGTLLFLSLIHIDLYRDVKFFNINMLKLFS